MGSGLLVVRYQYSRYVNLVKAKRPVHYGYILNSPQPLISSLLPSRDLSFLRQASSILVERSRINERHFCRSKFLQWHLIRWERCSCAEVLYTGLRRGVETRRPPQELYQ